MYTLIAHPWKEVGKNRDNQNYPQLLQASVVVVEQ